MAQTFVNEHIGVDTNWPIISVIYLSIAYEYVFWIMNGDTILAMLGIWLRFKLFKAAVVAVREGNAAMERRGEEWQQQQ